ncbi:recombinase [Phaeobacter italicus]|uniref:recombinase n=1 Tax=Phaeobacter italicus TaxID=481446 RepID=UPI002FDB69A8
MTTYHSNSGQKPASRSAAPARSPGAPNMRPEHRLAKTSGLLMSLHDSIERLRQEAEAMLYRLQCDSDEEALSTPRIAKLESLIRDSQKVEKTLVEQSHDHQAAAGLDLDAARNEIESRLSRLGASFSAAGLSERAERP